MRSNLLTMIFERDINKLDEQIKTIDDLTNEDIKLEKEYESTPSTPEEQKAYNDFKNDLGKYRDGRVKIIKFVKANNYEDAVKLFNSEMKAIRISMFEELDKCIEINQKSAE